MIAIREAGGDTVSDAWLDTLAVLVAMPQHAAFHLVTRISMPWAETPSIRRAVDARLRSRRLQSVETVANTIFPADMARRSTTTEDLVQRYLGIYPRLAKFRGNHRGTYFGRIVAYPVTEDGSAFDQLTNTIVKLRHALTIGPRLSSAYEGNILTADDERQPPASSAGQAVHTDVYHSSRDGGVRIGFPCLSSFAFHLDASANALHLLAQYRNEYLLERGYGNYLGLARLLAYVGEQVEIPQGELMIVAGHAKLESSIRWAAELVARVTPGAGYPRRAS